MGHVDKISSIWTEIEVILCVKSNQTRSSNAPLPSNVVADVNPFLYDPSNLPEGIWYVVYLEDPKQAKEGFWKARGDPCHVYSDSSIFGWRTTFEFYKGGSSNGHRTDWLMQEYSISDDVENKAKGATSLCRVFQSERGGENKSNNEDSKSEPLESKIHGGSGIYQAMLSYQEDNLLHADCFEKGDFLELDDLGQNSSSSSSGNSSCTTPASASDQYFDSDAMLKLLNHDEVNKPMSSSYKLSVSRPNDTVIITKVAAEESRVSGNDKGLEPVKAEASRDAGASSSNKGKRAYHESRVSGTDKGLEPVKADASSDAGASSSRQTAGGNKGKRAYNGKLIKKFLCFMAF